MGNTANNTNFDLVTAAKQLVAPLALGERGDAAGTVACALRTRDGNVFTGVCIDLACGIGFCAEHAAVAEMIKHRETAIETIVAVSAEGIIPPCGRCRELLVQVDPTNMQTLVMLPQGDVQPLAQLLPNHWMDWYAKPRASRKNSSATRSA